MGEGREGRSVDETSAVQEVRAGGASLKETLGLATEPVAVFLLGPAADLQPYADWERLRGHRYCQAVMQARHGAFVVVEAEELACPAAAAAFGFRPLPEGLASGKGLVGFGIVERPETGRTMFQHMPRLESGSIERLALCPLRVVPRVPDVVVVEGEPERLMWLVLADLNLAGGARREAHTAVLQATCVDATVVPYMEGRLNFSLGCYGCRDATDMGTNETVVGFPGQLTTPLAEAVAALSRKAIAASRQKGAYGHWQARALASPCDPAAR